MNRHGKKDKPGIEDKRHLCQHAAVYTARLPPTMAEMPGTRSYTITKRTYCICLNSVRKFCYMLT